MGNTSSAVAVTDVRCIRCAKSLEIRHTFFPAPLCDHCARYTHFIGPRKYIAYDNHQQEVGRYTHYDADQLLAQGKIKHYYGPFMEDELKRIPLPRGEDVVYQLRSRTVYKKEKADEEVYSPALINGFIDNISL